MKIFLKSSCKPLCFDLLKANGLSGKPPFKIFLFSSSRVVVNSLLPEIDINVDIAEERLRMGF